MQFFLAKPYDSCVLFFCLITKPRTCNIVLNKRNNIFKFFSDFQGVLLYSVANMSCSFLIETIYTGEKVSFYF